MTISPSQLKALVESELTLIHDARVIDHICHHLIEPEMVVREWTQEDEGQTYPCWTVFKHLPSNSGIAYCEHGFGPVMPWGIVELSGTAADMAIGMDFNWHFTLAEGWHNSMASADVPIWRVFTGRSPDSDDWHPVTPEDTWQSAGVNLEHLRRQNPAAVYEIDTEDYIRIRRLP